MKDIRALDGRFEGEPMWVVCTGTSLKGFPFEQLEDKITVAVNDAVLFFTPTVHVFNDRGCAWRYADSDRWKAFKPWRGHIGRCGTPPRREDWRYADGQIVATRPNCIKDYTNDGTAKHIDLYEWTHAGPKILPGQPSLYCSCTVATAAFQLAIRMGASRVGLLGVDCYSFGPKARYFWQDFDPSLPVLPASENETRFVTAWTAMRDWVKKFDRTITVTNYSPMSRCTAWPKADWREVFHASS
jgi:hypothetical protein